MKVSISIKLFNCTLRTDEKHTYCKNINLILCKNILNAYLLGLDDLAF